MRIGLRARLLLPVGAVVVLAVAVVAGYSGWIATVEFSRLEVLTETDDTPPPDAGEGLAAPLVEHFAQAGSWSGAQHVLERLNAPPGWKLLLFDHEGTLVAGTARTGDARVRRTPDGAIRIERDLEQGGLDVQQIRGPGVDIDVPDEGVVGTLCLFRPPTDDSQAEPSNEARAERFRGSLNRGLLLGVVAVGLAALGVAAVLIRRAVLPVETLTRAARRMAEGDLGQRVPVVSRDEIGELSAAFNAMADSLERLEKLRRDMVGDVAHELRTPLTNVRCQLESMQDGLVLPDASVIDSLHEEIAGLGRLVDDMQDLTLAAAGQMRLEPETLDLRAEIERAVARVRAGPGTVKPEISIDVPAGLALEADPRRLRQILGNLLSNAVGHTPAGGRIEVAARETGTMVEIRVRDTGPGIAAENLPNVFERFYRAEPSRNRGSGGAGLGLAIVRQLVELHGGDVGVESGLGRGATFRFRLPRRTG